MSNISVKVVADTTALQTQLALASAEAKAFTAELNNLAKQANAAGGATPELGAKMQQVAAQMLDAKKNVTSVKNEIAQSASGFQKYGSAVSLAQEALAAFGIAASAGSIIAFGKNVFDATEQIYHEAEVLGLSTQAYQDFTKAGMLAGVSTDTVDMALKKFNVSLGQAQTGVGAQAKAFNDLGVSAKLPGDQALPAVARAMLEVGFNARQARDMVAIFGKSGEEMRPLLEQLAQGTDALTEKLKDMGLELDDKTITAAHNAKVAMDTAWGQVDVAWAPAVVKMSGLLAGLVGWLGKYKQINDSIVSSIPAWARRDVFTGKEDFGPGSSYPSNAAPGGHAFVVGSNDKGGGSPKPNYTDDADAKKAADEARQAADLRAQAFEQGNLRHIQSEQQTNAFILEMGRESIEQWKAQAVDLENARYATEQDFIKKKEAADKGDVVKLAQDQAQAAQLYQQHTDNLTAIDQQYQQRRKQQDAISLQDFIQNKTAELQADVQALDAQFSSHQIDAQKRHDLEIQFTTQIENEVLKRFDAEKEGLDRTSAAYLTAMTERNKLVAQFNKQSLTANDALVTAQAAKLREAWAPVVQGFSSMVQGILSGSQTLGQTLARAADTMAEKWIESQLQEVENTIIAEQAKTDATVAGNVARNASDQTSASQSSGILSGRYVADIEGAAAKTYADVFAWAAPELGPFAAIPAAAAAVLVGAQAALVPSFDVGTNYVPRDMLAMVHQGERIIPAANNSALMDAISGGGSGQATGGGGDVHLHIHAIDTQSGAKFLKGQMPYIAKTLQAHLRSNPSLRPAT